MNNIEYWNIDRIRPYPANPRKISPEAVDAVARSITAFGFKSVVIVDAEGVVICGHTRLAAARQLGLTELPVWVARDLTPAQVKALRVTDNQVSSLTTWDDELLAAEVEALQQLSVDLSLLGFDADELTALLAPPATDGLTDPDDVPPVPKVAVTQPGDLYLLGRHRLLCGDSTDSHQVAYLLGGESADMVLSDPPYGVDYTGRTQDALKVENDDLDEAALARLVCKAFDGAQAVCRPGSYWYATVPAGPLHILFADDWKRRGILRQILVWAKDWLVLGHSEYHYQHEPILFGWMPGERHKNADRTRTTLWQYDRPKASREHPTMKPLALWEQAVTDGSRPGEIIYDPFLGSGTTVIAAEQLRRKCYGMELSPAYCDVIVRRWEQYTGKKAERISEQPSSEKAPAKTTGAKKRGAA